MSLVTRTPGPYRVNGVADQYVMATGTDNVPLIVAKATHRINAEFIVRACNAHDDLVRALAEAIKSEECNLAADGIEHDWLPNARMALARAVLV